VTSEGPPAVPTTSSTSQAALERVSDLAPAGSADVVTAFARVYLRRLPAGPLSHLGADELAGHVLDVFAFADGAGADARAVRVFNAETEGNGYRSAGTVVEIVAPDSPFLVDSVRAEIQAHGYRVANVVHPVIGTRRDEEGRLLAVLPARDAPSRESLQHHCLDRRIDEAAAATLTTAVDRVLADVRAAVSDFEPMKDRVARMIELAKTTGARYALGEISEAIAFLEWLLDVNFIFLGYREYRIVAEGGERKLQVVADSGLGILRGTAESAYARPVPLADLPPDLRARYESGDLLVISKTNRLATVHRRRKMDYIGLRLIDDDGSVAGEARLVGLFTSKAAMAQAATMPVLHRKLQYIVETEDLMEGTHDHKAVVQIFESFPKVELFAMSPEEVRQAVMGILDLHEQRRVRLFIRHDLFGRNVSVLVALPRDRFNAALRRRLQDMFMERFHGTSIDYHLALGEADPAQIHFTVWVEGDIPDVPYHDLELAVVALTRTWEDLLEDRLRTRVAEDEAARLTARWAPRFPEYYKASVDIDVAAGDVLRLDEQAERHEPLLIGLQNEEVAGPGAPLTRVALYRRGDRMELSEIVPHLEALGLRVVEEVPTRLRPNGDPVFIHDFGVLDLEGHRLDLDACGPRLAAALEAIIEGRAESDSLNRLVIRGEVSHEEVTILRAYRTYWRLVTATFTISYINDAFAAHPDLATTICRLFKARFSPDGNAETERRLHDEIVAGLDAVASLDEDRILRGFVDLIEATVRTNAYRPDRTCLALKLRSAAVPTMPEPHPLFEIFVTAPEVEGIHLRGGMIARGGIRWSTRRDDYRTEVLGLMKAQMTKNAVIVPTGSKGGFVIRRGRDDGDPAASIRSRYVTFIEGLLDVTDNLVDGMVMHPPQLRIHDGDDPYLVVAADKGTATLSDTANEVAVRYGYWLGDAFASGGATGYDHKELGITARGAWESVKAHFRERGLDPQTDPFTVIGIGDMSGDVFGNGMLLSPVIRLVAAFDHRDIFLDPDPDPARSLEERRRLSLLPRSSWQDYDRAVLSPGGGVFARSAKSIELSPEARQALGTEATTLTPQELVRVILRTPADLLWNGGIGTYVKASSESHADAGDRSNDAVRIDATELRCAAVGEGGNLGFTQRARIEYARGGGRILTDFIDNSAGVHCSDREVNLKILLGLAEERGELDRAGRDALVAEVAADVTQQILYDNFLQAQILSQEVETSPHRMEAYEEVMSQLEEEGLLDRAIEFLPGSEDMAERIRSRQGMTGPELAVLLAYVKRSLYEALRTSELPDWTFFADDLRSYFPGPVVVRSGHLVESHPLRRELIATIVANQVVNSEGVTFVSRLTAETGAEPAEVVRAYRIARAVTGAERRWADLEALVAEIEPEAERELMGGVDALVEQTARWFLTLGGNQPIEATIAAFEDDLRTLAEAMPEAGPAGWRAAHEATARELADRGIPPAVAARHAFQRDLVHGPAIVQLAHATGRDLATVAGVFFHLGEAVNLDWLQQQVDGFAPANRWQRLARQVVEDDLAVLRRDLAERVLVSTAPRPPEAAVQAYLAERPNGHRRLLALMRSLGGDGIADMDAAMVAIHQIRRAVG